MVLEEALSRSSERKRTQRQAETAAVRNQRQSPRRVFKHLVGILRAGSYQVASALQISEGGLLIQGNLQLKPQEDRIVVTILLPDGGHAVTRADVAYYLKPDANRQIAAFGLQFIDLQLHTKRFIRNYIAAKTEKEVETDTEIPALQS